MELKIAQLLQNIQKIHKCLNYAALQSYGPKVKN